MNRLIFALILLSITISCTNNKLEDKGFSINGTTEENTSNTNNSITTDSLVFETRPKNVLLTANSEHRLTPIYKVNYNKKTKKNFVGSNSFHYSYSENEANNGNNWNYNLMPGFEAVYGYNLVNISHFNISTKTKNTFFKDPVLIKTLYYPTFSKDTLNFQPVNRKFYMVSSYNEDTNNDGFLNVNDLRRLYFFDVNGENKKLLVPKNYSVLSSEYDSANDYMYVFAKKDENNNGKRDENESIHVFWIDLKDPNNSGRQY